MRHARSSKVSGIHGVVVPASDSSVSHAVIDEQVLDPGDQVVAGRDERAVRGRPVGRNGALGAQSAETHQIRLLAYCRVILVML